MNNQLQVGDSLPRLTQQVSQLQLFRYSAVTWNPHRIHFDESYARSEDHDGVVVHSHLRAALALRCVTEGLGPAWQVTTVDYRLRKPAYTPVELTYNARVTASSDHAITLELFEDHPSGDVGFEGTVTVTRANGLEER